MRSRILRLAQSPQLKRKLIARALLVLVIWVAAAGFPQAWTAPAGISRVRISQGGVLQACIQRLAQCRVARAASPRVPVVLIAESGTGPDGPPALWDASGLVERLEAEGYSRGADLFTFCPGVFRDFSDGSVTLAGFVRGCIAQSEAGEVDVVACGVSGLLMRFALESGLLPDGAVRNLIMVSSPNRGTFVADLLRSITEIVKHESLLEQETRPSRYLPFGEDIFAGGQSSGSKERAAGEGTPAPRDGPDTGTMTWEDETTWVAERVRRVYEPLYARYVEERFYTLPYLPTESPKETFAGWVCRTMPVFWESTVRGGILPPDGSRVAPVGQGSGSSPASSGPWTDGDGLGPVSRLVPQAGRDLTRAYYEVLSMEVARNQYVMRLASKGSIGESLFKQPYVPSGWKDALAHYGQRVLVYYARKALVTVKAEVQEFVADRIVRLTGFLEDPASPMLRRLVKDDMLVNLGTSSSERFERLPANYYLASVNETSMDLSTGRKTRYVSMASRLANPWSLVWPQLGPNDLFLEVDSSIAPTGVKDWVAVFRGFLAPSRSGLLGDRRAQEYIVSLICGEGGGRADALAVSDTGDGANPDARVTLSSWRPSYVQVNTQTGSGQDVAVTLPDPPEGWQYAVWTEAAGPGSSTSICRADAFSQGGMYSARVPEGGLLGFRLLRAGPANPVFSGTVGSAYATEVRTSGVVSLDAGGGPIAAGATSPSVRAPSDSVPGGATSGGPKPAAPLQDDLPPADAPPAGAPAAGAEIPMVRAVYRNKRTTLKNPSETYHDYWQVDFGDGSAVRIDGSPALTLFHTFAGKGTYRVRAVSYGNRGEELLMRDWTVEVGGGGAGGGTGGTGGTGGSGSAGDASRRFSCSSIARPKADLTLTGPKMWVTGKPAQYDAELKLELPAGAELLSLQYDPGQKFEVLWERAGDFTVSCAAVVKLRYLLEDRTVAVENTYVREMSVTVLTTGVTR